MTELQVLELLRRRVREIGNQSKAAEDLGVSPSFLSDVLASRRPLSAPKLLEGLGLQQIVTYEPADSNGRSLDSRVVVELTQLGTELEETNPGASNRLKSLLVDFGYHPGSAVVASLLA